MKELFSALFNAGYSLHNLRAISKGRYSIYLEKDGKEVVGSEVTIK